MFSICSKCELGYCSGTKSVVIKNTLDQCLPWYLSILWFWKVTFCLLGSYELFHWEANLDHICISCASISHHLGALTKVPLCSGLSISTKHPDMTWEKVFRNLFCVDSGMFLQTSEKGTFCLQSLFPFLSSSLSLGQVLQLNTVLSFPIFIIHLKVHFCQTVINTCSLRPMR